MVAATNSANINAATFAGLNSVLAGAVFSIFKVIIGIFLFAIVAGGLVGIFTYGRSRRQNRRTSPIEDALLVGEGLVHALIDSIRGRLSGDKSGRHTWLSDRQILAGLRHMNPTEFERFVASMFTAFGYDSRQVGGGGDGGIDVEMTKDGRRYVVQCKKFITRKVEPHDVRDFYGAMGDRHVDGKGFFVTTNIFTLEAERFAEGKPIELIDGEKLVHLVRQSGVMPGAGVTSAAATPAVTSAAVCPKCGGKLVVRTNRQDSTRFFGCSNFPRCHYTTPA